MGTAGSRWPFGCSFGITWLKRRVATGCIYNSLGGGLAELFWDVLRFASPTLRHEIAASRNQLFSLEKCALLPVVWSSAFMLQGLQRSCNHHQIVLCYQSLLTLALNSPPYIHHVTHQDNTPCPAHLRRIQHCSTWSMVHHIAHARTMHAW